MSKFICIVFISGWILGSSLLAEGNPFSDHDAVSESEPTNDQKEPLKHHLTFATYFLSNKDGHTRVDWETYIPSLYFFNGTKGVKLELSPAHTSSSLYEFDGKLPVVNIYDVDPTSVLPVPQPIISANFLPTWDRATLIVFEETATGKHNAVFTPSIEDLSLRKPIRVINLGPEMINFTVGQESLRIAPHMSEDMKFDFPEGANVQVTIHVKKKDEEKLVYSSNLFFKSDVKILLLPYKPNPNRNFWMIKQVKL